MIANRSLHGTPLVLRQRLGSAADHLELEKASPAKHSKSMSAAGRIQYIVVATCPGIADACSALGMHIYCSSVEHWALVQDVLRYLQRRSLWGSRLRAQGRVAVEAYKHADFATNKSLKRVFGMFLNVYGSVLAFQKTCATCWGYT